MPKEEILDILFQKRGVFEFEPCYAAIVAFMKGKGFKVAETGVVQKLGDELTVTWSTYHKITHYIRYDVIIESKATFITPVELPDKRSGYQASVQVRITGTITTDYNEDYDQSEFTKLMRKVKERFFLRKEIRAKKKMLEELGKDLYNLIKDYLQSVYVE